MHLILCRAGYRHARELGCTLDEECLLASVKNRQADCIVPAITSMEAKIRAGFGTLARETQCKYPQINPLPEHVNI